MGITEKPNARFILGADPKFSPFRDLLARASGRRPVKAKASKKKRGR